MLVVVAMYFFLSPWIYRLIHNIERDGWNAPEVASIAFLVLFPFMLWALAKGVKRTNTSKMARIRALYPGSLVLPAGRAWFMAPPLRSWPQRQYDRTGYLPFVLVATADRLRIYRERFRGQPTLAGEVPWKAVRSVRAFPAKEDVTRIDAKVLALDLDSGRTDLADPIELYLCSDDGEVLVGGAFDEAEARLESIRVTGLRDRG
ncbi:hypothetical protein [Sinomonas sp. ASV322]|uniref:hypothetical protein n=1 Tax=Sinomonas sp. ASV322 TaxID=3041920 RepID=UPI0027DDE933|nr:hypothetical protein [Sinomonas sp. ASV322]MDQ4501067.1 hypothetical protein [Sinomonas sp. ASV322]